MLNDNFDGKFLIISKLIFDATNVVDFFVVKYITGGVGFFVSERLKKEIETEHCTGIVFTEPNERYP